jgi:flavin reductase (DIM6/NTAB) family NADH-FMN oxidoreductase RutF
MAKRSLPLSQVYRLIEPGPLVMLTTASGGQANIMTLTWHMMVDFEPPVVACVISHRNYTFGILRQTKECVLNIPTVQLARKAVACGNISGRNIDKFKKFDLTPRAAASVRAPLIAECYANLECRVKDTKMSTQYNIFIVEVVKAWIDRSQKHPRTIHHHGHGTFVVDGETITVPSRMK